MEGGWGGNLKDKQTQQTKTTYLCERDLIETVRTSRPVLLRRKIGDR